MTKFNTRRLVESALMIAIATILATFVKIDAPWAFGGSITLCSALPIIVIAFRYGIPWGLFTGFVFSVLQILTGMSALKGISVAALIGSLVLDYFVAFTAFGFAPVFRKIIKNQTLALVTGTAFVLVIRFVAHFLSGTLIFGSYAPENMYPAVYSLIYNAGYMVPEIILTCAAAAILSKPILNGFGQKAKEA